MTLVRCGGVALSMYERVRPHRHGTSTRAHPCFPTGETERDPVRGSMLEKQTRETWMRLQTEPLDVAEVLRFLQTPAAGGIDLFVGTTRRWTDGRETSRLSYEAYEPMALKEMQELADEVRSRWSAERVCLWHRIGEVPPPEVSVILGVATPHRAEAFAATRFLIDTLKERVPIWKKEVYADGATEWVTGTMVRGVEGESL